MLVKVCNQIVVAKPLTQLKVIAGERRIVPMNTNEFRYLRFKAIGNLEVSSFNGNWDGFPYEHFEDSRPGFGYKSFINKRAHYEHNCIVHGTMILMEDFSYKPIEFVEIGDRVWTHAGTCEEVTNVFEYDHTEGLVKLKAEGILRPLFFTHKHPLWLVKKDKKAKAVRKVANIRNNQKRKVYVEESQEMLAGELQPEWILSKDTVEKDYLVIPYPKVDHIINPELNGLDMARFMGFYASEGSIQGDRDVWGDSLNQVVQFSFNKKETEYIDFIIKFAEKRGIKATTHIGTASRDFGTNSCIIVDVPSSEYADMMNLYCGRNAKKKCLSEDIMRMPLEWQVEFLKAYFEGDANINEEQGIKGSTASYQLALQIQIMCAMHKVWCNVKEFKQHIPNDAYVKNCFGNAIYVFNITTHEALQLFGDYFKFRNKASNLSVAKTNYGFLVPVKYKEELPYEGKVYNLEVTNQNSYTVYNIAVHNSGEGISGSIGDLPDAFLNKFDYPEPYSNYKWVDLSLSKDLAPIRAEILQLPMQKDGSIEVLMRIDTTLVKSAKVNRKIKSALERLVRMIDTGQRLTCSMGCYAPGAKVMLGDGTYKKIENMRRNDSVLTHKGVWSYVQDATVHSYKGDMYKFKVTSLPDQVMITPEHPVWAMKKLPFCACGCGERVNNQNFKWIKGHSARVFNNNKEYSEQYVEERVQEIETLQEQKLEWIYAKDLEEGDYVSYPIDETEIPAPHITPGKARLIGYFLAEGSYLKYKPLEGDAYKSAVAFSFGYTEKDKPFIEEVIRLCNEEWPDANPKVYTAKDYIHEHNKHKYIQNFNGCVEIRLHKKYIAQFFEFYCGEYAKNKKLPEEVLTWPKYLQMQLLGAYFNGDGTKGRNGVASNTISETLAYQLSYILKRIKVPHSFTVGNWSYQKNIIYTLTIHNEWEKVLEEFWSYEYEPKSRDLSPFDIKDNYILMPIRKIEKIPYNGPVYNLDVAGDHSFVASGFATHNTNVAYSVCSACGNEARFANEYCFIPGTPILMEDFTVKNIEDVKRGDVVVDADGNMVKVIKQFKRKVSENIQIFRSRFIDQALGVTGNHPFKVKRRNKYTFVEAEKLEDNEILYCPLTKVKESEELFDLFNFAKTEKNKESFCRLLGYFTAEGSFMYQFNTKKISTICFSFHAEEDFFIKDVKDIVKDLFNIDAELIDARNKKNHAANSISLRLHNTNLAEIFEKVIKGGASEKILSEKIIKLPKKYLKQFLSGYIDGDGHFNKRGHVIISTASKNLAFQVSHLFLRLGLAPSLNHYKNFGGLKHPEQELIIYKISVPLSHIKKIESMGLKWEGAQAVKGRKWDKLLNTMTEDGLYVEHKSYGITEEYYDGYVYNLETESHTYVANNTAVHNCDHLGQFKKGGLTITTANQVRDLLDREKLRPEWMKWICASKFDVDEVLKGSSNKSIAVRNGEINHELSFFELSVVSTPAFSEAIMLEKFARKQSEERREYLRRIRKEVGDDNILDIYGLLQDDGLISQSCAVS